MKRISQYTTTLLLLLAIGISCKGSGDSWGIITDAQPGAHITGGTTTYNTVATSPQLVIASLDGAPGGIGVMGIYTWLKLSRSFTILNVDEEGNKVSYGEGGVVASTPAGTVTLAAGGIPFTIVKSGLCYVAMSKTNNRLMIIPARFGVIDDATSLQWNGETVIQAGYNEAQTAVGYSISDAVLDKGEMKFHYSGD